MVTTVFVANAILDYLEQKGSERAFGSLQASESDLPALVDGACRFMIDNLVLFETPELLCFGYIPGEEARVHNVNMLGAALLARICSLTGNERVFMLPYN